MPNLNEGNLIKHGLSGQVEGVFADLVTRK